MATSYFMRYPIDNTSEDIQKHLIKWENQSSPLSSVELIKVMRLGGSNTQVAFYKAGSAARLAVMEEGFNGNLRIVRSDTQKDKLDYEWIETSEGRYGVVTGVNVLKGLASIQDNLEGLLFGYEIDIPDDPYFMIAKKVPEEVDKTYSLLRFFSQQN
ncbi:hypothetical protein [Bacillus thermotolerans]|nr:hypothetical protein [Bacillus thermotolerans]